MRQGKVPPIHLLRSCSVGDRTAHSSEDYGPFWSHGTAFMEEDSLRTKWKETSFEEQLKSC